MTRIMDYVAASSSSSVSVHEHRWCGRGAGERLTVRSDVVGRGVDAGWCGGGLRRGSRQIGRENGRLDTGDGKRKKAALRGMTVFRGVRSSVGSDPV